jgi:tellurite resistance protein
VACSALVLNRLFFRQALPPALVPTLAIEVAPPVVGGLAWFAINGGKIDFVAAMLGGYAIAVLTLITAGIALLAARTVAGRRQFLPAPARM